ncbi:hypothetical protein L1987_45187 [Smallanthus sonchifolius]|uniref:Uncharacterized protein n=1 Tax=Smallanthus sonchifolius TaxID=185202 RepID=A0ACB9GRE7_9ASTR|nr:hypothetical protein L1987_45187 [Smallanthus sonchifolius]
MGNSTSQRVNSPSPSPAPSPSGLGFYFSYSVNEHLIGFFKQKSIFIHENSPAAGLTTIIHDSIPLSSNIIVFPPLIALQILYSAPGELWNWNHPKPRDFPATHTISARDGIVIPTSADEITSSEEYTCVISTKDGYPKMTHFYGNTVVDCHPIPRSMAAAILGGGNHRPMYRGESSDDPLSEEFVNHCYICKGNKKQTGDTFMQRHEGLCNNECDNDESEAKIKIKETETGQ